MRLDLATAITAMRAEVLRIDQSEHGVPGHLSPGDLRCVFHDVCIDSRLTAEDSLFFALPGQHVDGHTYVAEAFRRGALACVVSRLPERIEVGLTGDQKIRGESRYLLVVPDPLVALQRLATQWRREHDTVVVGVTGSVGKTTTKEIVAGVLGAHMMVLKSEANLNTEIGLPLTLLGLRQKHRVAVLEMGMHERGDIALLARIAEPTMGIVTNVAPVHLERMGSIDRIAHEKSELVMSLPEHGLAIVNGDNPWTRAMAQVSGVAPAVTVGLQPDCDFRASNLESRGLRGLSFTLHAEGKTVPMHSTVPGVHTVHALLTAAAAARRFGMSWDEIREAIANVRVDLRQQILRGPGGVTIIDDSYNAAPPSMIAALDLLRASPGTKIAVLGDMLELGPEEQAAHVQVGEQAAKVADWLVVRGPRSKWIAEGAVKNGLEREHVIRTENNVDAVETVRRIIGAGGRSEATSSDRTMHRVELGALKAHSRVECTVLVKGSRGMKMEEVVQGLRGEP